MRPGQRGLSLIELLVVVGLLGLLISLALSFMLSMFRDSGRAIVRHGLQTRGLLLCEELLKALRSTGEPGLTLHDDEEWTGFSVIGLSTVTTTGQQVWNDELTLYGWNKQWQRMEKHQCPPLPAGFPLRFAPDRPPRLQPDQFVSLFATEGRLLCDKVTRFEIVQSDGLVSFDLELREDIGTGSSERFFIQRELSFKS